MQFGEEMDFREHDEQHEDFLCRVCEQPGEFELSENEFEYETKEVTLLTAFNSFSSVDNVSETETFRIRNCQLKLIHFSPHKDDVAVYLCQKCTDQLIEAYKFAQQVKISDQIVASKLLHVEADVDADVEAVQTTAKCGKSDNVLELLETDDELETAQITSKRTRKTGKPSDTKRIKREISPKKPSHNESNALPMNFALAQYVITSNTLDEDDEQCDEYATQTLELDSKPLDDEVDGQKHENEPSPTRNRVKTLKTSAIVATNLQEIGDLCAITIDGDHDSQSIYQCKYCPKAFAGPYHLMVHTRKSHQCQYCLSAFVKVNDLYKHVKEMHNSFECLLCGRIFRTNGNLRQHMRKNHAVFLPAHVSLLNASEAHNNDDIGETPPNPS